MWAFYTTLVVPESTQSNSKNSTRKQKHLWYLTKLPYLSHPASGCRTHMQIRSSLKDPLDSAKAGSAKMHQEKQAPEIASLRFRGFPFKPSLARWSVRSVNSSLYLFGKCNADRTGLAFRRSRGIVSARRTVHQLPPARCQAPDSRDSGLSLA